MLNRLDGTTFPLTFDLAQVGDKVTTRTANYRTRTGTIIRKTARRLFIANYDGTTSHIGPNSAPGVMCVHIGPREAITTRPLDNIHANRLTASHPPTRLAKAALADLLATQDLNEDIVAPLADIARLALSAWATPTHVARTTVNLMIMAEVRESLGFTGLAQMLKLAQDLLDDIQPPSTATDTWQVTTRDSRLLGYVQGATNDAANAQARETFTVAQLRNGFGMRRLADVEIIELGL